MLFGEVEILGVCVTARCGGQHTGGVPLAYRERTAGVPLAYREHTVSVP